MKIRIKKCNAIDDLIWFLMLFQIMIGNFIGVTRSISLIVLALITFSSVKKIKFYADKQILVIISFFCCVLIYPVFSFLKDGGDPYILVNNIYYIITPFALLLYTGMSCIIKSDYTKRRLDNILPLLNVYALINIFVMVFQLVYNENLYSNSTAYKDSVSGLFGIYAQPNITIYITSIVLLDYLYLKNDQIMKYVFGIKLSLVYKIIFIAYFVLSSLNDNKAFYIIFLLFTVYIWLVSNYKHAVQKKQLHHLMMLLFKILALTLIGIILFAILINYTFVGDFYNRIMHEVIQGWNSTNLVQGSSERIGMISYALSNTETRIDGYGLATTIWKQEFAFGFMHFGQSDVGVFILLGGLLFIGLIVIYLFFVLKQVLRYNLLAIFGIIIMIITGIYTQIFTTYTMMGCMILFLLTCRYAE